MESSGINAYGGVTGVRGPEGVRVRIHRAL